MGTGWRGERRFSRAWPPPKRQGRQGTDRTTWPCSPRLSAQGGQTTEGLEALAEALGTLTQSAVRWWEAELYRLRGELLLQTAVSKHRQREAEACFQQALDIARRQQAKSLELRAAMSLSRLWQHQGKRAQARELLAADLRLVHRGV